MSRYSGPQQRGAEQQARVEKRQQAEVRQREERERDAKRRAEATKCPESELSEAEVDALVYAVAAIRFGELVAGLSPRWKRQSQQPTNGPEKRFADFGGKHDDCEH